jgi:hypothetical protein
LPRRPRRAQVSDHELNLKYWYFVWWLVVTLDYGWDNRRLSSSAYFVTISNHRFISQPSTPVVGGLESRQVVVL